ncbi:hypothetical protein AB832_03125 [Flavobacteriaceae bacterium (ex Bugula neritina AB1)]|nr:hypothetical protein AB832_03125 [Flavobacteriaceae bacterium (ex Bugula neritina AB1)]
MSNIPEEDHLNFLWSKVLQTDGKLSSSEQKIINRFMEVYRANEKAFYEYRPKPLEISSIYFYRATKTIENSDYKENIINQWSNLISGDVIEVPIEGNHYSLVEKEESKIISKSISNTIKRKEVYQFS